MQEYLLNCFLLLIPILIWNIIFTKKLPKLYSKEIFWKDIPKHISIPENTLRIIVFVLPAFMKLSFESTIQIIGLIIYAMGVIDYFTSWIIQIYFSEKAFSKSLLGFLAPAFTPITWLVGVGLIGSENFLEFEYLREIYLGVVVLFVVWHCWHVVVVWRRK